MNELTENINKRIDDLEEYMVGLPEVNCQLSHEFMGNVYVRTIMMPAVGEGTLVVSKIHKTEHPFVIHSGTAYVKENDGKWIKMQAPWQGRTLPGTRRILFVVEDCIWSTYHALEPGETTPEQVEERIIEKYDHPYTRIKKEMEELQWHTQ